MAKANKKEKTWRDAGKRAFEVFQEALEEKNAGIKKVAQRIAQGLNAKKITYFQTGGEVMEHRIDVDFSERRKYAELAVLIYGGKAPEKYEHQVDGRMTVKIVKFSDGIKKEKRSNADGNNTAK